VKFSRQDRGLSDTERALRSARPEIDPAVQGEILARISARPAQRSRGFRVVLAGVMTAGVFGAMAAFGGVSYATNSVYHSTGVSNTNTGWSYTPSCDQYGNKDGKHKKNYYNNYPGKGGFGGFGFFGGW
jgi:hypothetical protein